MQMRGGEPYREAENKFSALKNKAVKRKIEHNQELHSKPLSQAVDNGRATSKQHQ